jgi:hypothetical protein
MIFRVSAGPRSRLRRTYGWFGRSTKTRTANTGSSRAARPSPRRTADRAVLGSPRPHLCRRLPRTAGEECGQGAGNCGACTCGLAREELGQGKIDGCNHALPLDADSGRSPYSRNLTLARPVHSQRFSISFATTPRLASIKQDETGGLRLARECDLRGGEAP